MKYFTRFREDEVKAEMAEREVQKLQKEVDKLEVNMIMLNRVFLITELLFRQMYFVRKLNSSKWMKTWKAFFPVSIVFDMAGHIRTLLNLLS